MRGGRARGKAKKNDFILKKLKENAFIQKNFFSPFSLLALNGASNRRVRSSPVLGIIGSPGLAAVAVVLERRTSRPGTSAARHRLVQVVFLCRPASRQVQGAYYRDAWPSLPFGDRSDEKLGVSSCIGYPLSPAI